MDTQCNCTSFYCCISQLDPSQRCEIESLVGLHKDGTSKEDIWSLLFRDSKFQYLPIGLEEFFPHLRELHLANCELKSITSNCLQGLKNLETLILTQNGLKSLPDDLFKHSQKLKSFVFVEDHPTFMSSRLFDPIPDQEWQAVVLSCGTIKALYRKDGQLLSEFENWLESPQLLKCFIDSSCLHPIHFPYKANTNNFEKLWKGKAFFDLTVIVDSKELQVHKRILANQSTVFASKFKDDVSMTKLEIDGYSVEVVETFLRLFYIGEVEDNKNALEIFSISCDFDVPILRSIYEEIVVRSLTDEAIMFRALKIGALHKSDRIMSASFSELRLLYPGKISSEGLKHNPQRIKEIIEASKEHQLNIQKFDKTREKMIRIHEQKIRKLNEELK